MNLFKKKKKAPIVPQKYIVVRADCHKELQRTVNERAKSGWKATGSAFSSKCPYEHKTRLYQPMTK